MRGARGPVDAATVAAIRAQTQTPSALVSLRAAKDDGGHRDDDPGIPTAVGIGDAQVRPRPDAAADVAAGEARAPLRVGLTYPALIAYVYGISGAGSTLTSQAVFASDDQVRFGPPGRRCLLTSRHANPPWLCTDAQVLALGDLEMFQGGCVCMGMRVWAGPTRSGEVVWVSWGSDRDQIGIR